MHSHSFQGTEYKFHGYVNDSPGQVVKRLTILPFPRGVSNKAFTTQKTFIQRAFAQFQNIKLKLHRYVCDWSGVEDSTIPPELSRIKSYDHQWRSQEVEVGGAKLRAKPESRARSARELRAKPESRAEPEI